MGNIAHKIASRAASMAPADSAETAEIPEEAAVEEAASPAEASGAEAPLPAPETIEQATGEDELSVRKSILAEKLAAARERRQAAREHRERSRLESRSQAQIEAALEAANAEKAKWESLKVGSFKDGLRALGRDPLKTFQELEREAAEANTPEGQLARLREELSEKLEAATKKIEELEAERAASRSQAEEQAVVARFEADFGRQLQEPGYRALRVAYEDEEILQYAHGYRLNPKAFHHDAQKLGVRLTNPARGFTMREILTVLKAAQEAYEGKRKAREAKLSGQSGSQTESPRVNGTSAPEAVSTIGADLASSRASGGEPKRASRAERIDREIDRLERRR